MGHTPALPARRLVPSALPPRLLSSPPFASYQVVMPTFVPPVDRETGERLLDAFAQELLDKVRTVLRESDHATKLERVATVISKTPSGVTALAVLALVVSVDELGARRFATSRAPASA